MAPRRKHPGPPLHRRFYFATPDGKKANLILEFLYDQGASMSEFVVSAIIEKYERDERKNGHAEASK